MHRTRPLHRICLIALLACLWSGWVAAAQVDAVTTLAARHKAPLLDTLKDLVSIESGSGDREGLDRIAALIAQRLQTLGGKVEQLEAGPDIYRMVDKIGRAHV